MLRAPTPTAPQSRAIGSSDLRVVERLGPLCFPPPAHLQHAEIEIGGPLTKGGPDPALRIVFVKLLGQDSPSQAGHPLLATCFAFRVV